MGNGSDFSARSDGGRRRRRRPTRSTGIMPVQRNRKRRRRHIGARSKPPCSQPNRLMPVPRNQQQGRRRQIGARNELITCKTKGSSCQQYDDGHLASYTFPNANG